MRPLFKFVQKVFAFCSLVTLSACATNNRVDYELLQINSLASADENNGSFQGLEFLAQTMPGQNKARVNILYLHGIGYTEDRTATALASDFLSGIARAYDLDAEDGLIGALCGEGDNHLYINASKPVPFRTLLPDSQLQLSRLACMDKQKLDIGEDIEFVLYRVFWDTVFWDALQYPHVGQDDDRGSSETLALQRQKYNRILKDDLVNYGFSDAVMYLGEAGDLIRDAVRGAMCIAAIDAAGGTFSNQTAIDVDTACSRTWVQEKAFAPFAFVTESLGSKVMFDVMRDVRTDQQETIHDTMIVGSETFMLANQIALFGLSDLGRIKTRMPDLGPDRPTLIAVSEINDFLSYEIVPFLEQLYRNSYRPDGVPLSIPTSARDDLVKEFGFNVVDVRTRFADKIIPVVGSFVDPKDAHTGHAQEPGLMHLILCGAEAGIAKTEGCLATSNPK